MRARHTVARLVAALLAAQTLPAVAVEVRFERAADNVYAHVGDIGARSVADEGLNANLGLVVTPAGAVLIDSRATFRSARSIRVSMSARPFLRLSSAAELNPGNASRTFLEVERE